MKVVLGDEEIGKVLMAVNLEFPLATGEFVDMGQPAR